MANLLAMRLTLTLIGIVCAVCFGLAVGYRNVLVLGTLVAGGGLLVQVTGDVLSIPLQAQLQLGRLTAIEIGRRVLALLLIGVFALVGAGLLPLLAASTFAGAVALVCLTWVVRSSLTARLSFDWKAWRLLFAETLPYAIAVSIGAIYFYVTVVIMSLIASPTQTGLFSTSFRIILVAIAVPVLLLTAIFPLMSRERDLDDAHAGDMVGKVFTVALICGVWMSLAAAIGAGFIVDVIAGHQGSGAAAVLRIQGLMLTISFISTSSALGLISRRRYRPMIVVSSWALALNIGLGLVLVPALGARGGALADVVTETLVAAALTVVLMRAVPQHHIKVSVVPRVVLASALAATALLAPVGPIARVIVATVIYFAVLLRLGAIPDEVIGAARRLRAMRAPLT